MPLAPRTHRIQFARIPEVRASAARRGYGAAWRRFREAYLLANPLCVTCRAEGRIVAAEHVDHKQPRQAGDPEVPEDDEVQGLCASCHGRKTATCDGGFGHGG